MKQHLDFIVIGAQKSGTTALFEYLRRHPDLYLPAGKEAPFFSHDSNWHDGWSEYVRRNFALAGDAQRWGTVTPHYMYGSLSQSANPDALATESRPERLVPERIASHSPEARLVAILREPVERAYSHYRMERFREAEQRPFDQAVDELLQPQRLERSRRRPNERSTYVTNGEYGRILAPFFELFGAGRILVCFTNDLASAPAGTLSSILKFIGVDDEFRPRNLGRRYRVAGSRRRMRRLDLERVQRSAASNRRIRSAWHVLPAGMRGRIDRGLRELTYQADVRDRIAPRGEEPLFEEARERLRAHYAHDRERLRTLIDREPPW